MKKVCAILFLASFATGLLAQSSLMSKPAAAFSSRIVYTLPRGVERPAETEGLLAKAFSNHGGPVITSAHVVFLFWGPTFANATSADHAYATALQTFRNGLGTTGEYNVITQYCGSNGCVALTNLGAGTPDWFDTRTPPVKVTDALVQGEVNAYLASHTFDANAIYEVVIPSTSYSDDGTGATSCGGPSLAYCAYHSWIGSGVNATKYSIQPYPSCSGCKVSSWTATQNQEHFVCHETREAVTDPTGSTWWDGTTGQELDDKCAWSPTPFLFNLNGVTSACQYEWSKVDGRCVATK